MEGMQPSAIVPELIVLAGSVLALVTGLFVPRRRQWLIAAGAVATLALALAAAVLAMATDPQLVFAGTFAADGLTAMARIVILAGTLLVVGLAFEPLRGHARETEFYVLLLFSVLGSLLLAGAADLMLVIVAYLLSSIPLYTLTAFEKNAAGTEAAMKFLLMGGLLGIIMLYGFAFLYGLGGATTYSELAAGIDGEVRGALLVGLIAGSAGLAFKLGATPAHFWVPDVTAGAPAAVAAYVTTLPKIAALAAVARLFHEVVPEAIIDWRLLVALLAVASMTLGNLAAFWQETPRRLLAYSSISQIGYLLMAVVVIGRSELAFSGLFYYAGAYAAMNLGAFAVVAALPQAGRLGDYSNLARRQPALALALTVCLLSLIGIPPLAGFVGKLAVFSAAWDGGYAWLTVLAALNTVVSVFYYFRWIAITYRQPADESAAPIQPVYAIARTVACCAALAVLALGLGAQGLLE